MGVIKFLWGLVSSKASSFLPVLAGFKGYFIAAGIAAVIAAGFLHWRHDVRTADDLERARNELAVMLNVSRQAVVALERNYLALKKCREANAANSLLAEEQKRNAAEAAARIATLEAMRNRDVEDISRETEEMRNEQDLDCPAINHDFRQWVRSD